MTKGTGPQQKSVISTTAPLHYGENKPMKVVAFEERLLKETLYGLYKNAFEWVSAVTLTASGIFLIRQVWPKVMAGNFEAETTMGLVAAIVTFTVVVNRLLSAWRCGAFKFAKLYEKVCAARLNETKEEEEN